MAGFLSVGLDTQIWLAEAKEIFLEKPFTQQKYTPSFSTAFRELDKLYKITNFFLVGSPEFR